MALFTTRLLKLWNKNFPKTRGRQNLFQFTFICYFLISLWFNLSFNLKVIVIVLSLMFSILNCSFYSPLTNFSALFTPAQTNCTKAKNEPKSEPHRYEDDRNHDAITVDTFQWLNSCYVFDELAYYQLHLNFFHFSKNTFNILEWLRAALVDGSLQRFTVN